MKYKHHECRNCGCVWDACEYMDKCPDCGSSKIDQSESDERVYRDFYEEDEDDI